MKNHSFVVLVIVAFFAILLSGCSYIKIVDPTKEEYSFATPHDLVVAHKGCGRANGDSLRAYLDKGEPCENEITDAFQYDSHGEKWIAAQYDLPPGRRTFTAYADVWTGAWCLNFQRTDSREFTVTADPDWLPREKTFHIDTTFHYPGPFGMGEVLLTIESLNFLVPIPAEALIDFNLTTQPSGLPICYCLYPDPAPSECESKQIKYRGYCYPVGCGEYIGVSEPFLNTFTEEILNTNGTCWTLELGTLTKEYVPVGDYHISGTISVSFRP